jgi:hypothetical protein
VTITEQSPDELRIVHLAVHPSAWSSTPPDIPQATPAASSATPLPRPMPQNPPEIPISPATNFPPPIPQPTQPLAFVLLKHQNALRALTHGAVGQVINIPDLEASRSAAVQVVEAHGWSWPAILDEPFPAATAGGVMYERVTIKFVVLYQMCISYTNGVSFSGQNFLSLTRPSEEPTVLQAHALKVLTYTFSLLSIPATQTTNPHTLPSQAVSTPPNVNLLLQQLGLPQLRVAQNLNANPNPNRILPELRELHLRRLVVPLLMLLFRTLLLLYFVAPARKPIFGVLIVAWMLYEIWRPIRHGLIRGLQRGVPNDRAREDAAAQQEPRPAQDVPVAPRPPQNFLAGIAAERVENQAVAAVLDAVSNLNISTEEQILNDSPGVVTREPGFGHKFMTFLSLFLMTIHPAMWNQRRASLRQREGRIRTEENARNSRTTGTDSEEGQDETRARLQTELREQYARRPLWIRNYMERVVANDWVDDSE